MSQIEDTRSKWSEDKKAKIAVLERKHQASLERLKRTLYSRNALASEKLPEAVLIAQIQALVATADIGSLVDTLEVMGRIDRVDFMSNCVARFEEIVSSVERVN